MAALRPWRASSVDFVWLYGYLAAAIGTGTSGCRMTGLYCPCKNDCERSDSGKPFFKQLNEELRQTWRDRPPQWSLAIRISPHITCGLRQWKGRDVTHASPRFSPSTHHPALLKKQKRTLPYSLHRLLPIVQSGEYPKQAG